MAGIFLPYPSAEPQWRSVRRDCDRLWHCPAATAGPDSRRAAEEFALLDCLSGGRLDFGIGRGFQKLEYDALERNMADSRVLFEEAHDMI
jgi:hypothetical protein